MSESTYRGQRLERPQTVRTTELSEGLEGIEGNDFLAVVGPFGFSGLYPLSEALHCGLYFLKMASLDGTRAVVTENTHYWLKYRGACLRDEEICSLCLNRSCPPNKNPLATEEEGRPGVFKLSLD